MRDFAKSIFDSGKPLSPEKAKTETNANAMPDTKCMPQSDDTKASPAKTGRPTSPGTAGTTQTAEGGGRRDGEGSAGLFANGEKTETESEGTDDGDDEEEEEGESELDSESEEDECGDPWADDATCRSDVREREIERERGGESACVRVWEMTREGGRSETLH